VTLFKDFEE